jgi:hypothetical protein
LVDSNGDAYNVTVSPPTAGANEAHLKGPVAFTCPVWFFSSGRPEKKDLKTQSILTLLKTDRSI